MQIRNVKSALINAQVIFETPYKDAGTESKISFVSTDKTKQTHKGPGNGFEG